MENFKLCYFYSDDGVERRSELFEKYNQNFLSGWAFEKGCAEIGDMVMDIMEQGPNADHKCLQQEPYFKVEKRLNKLAPEPSEFDCEDLVDKLVKGDKNASKYSSGRMNISDSTAYNTKLSEKGNKHPPKTKDQWMEWSKGQRQGRRRSIAEDAASESELYDEWRFKEILDEIGALKSYDFEKDSDFKWITGSINPDDAQLLREKIKAVIKAELRAEKDSKKQAPSTSRQKRRLSEKSHNIFPDNVKQQKYFPESPPPS